MHFYHILIFIAFSSVLYYNKSNEITWNFILSCNTIRRILMNEKGLTNISLKKINKSKVYQIRPQEQGDFQITDRFGPSDGLIHCQSESESAGAGGIDRKKRIFRFNRRKKSTGDSVSYLILRFPLASVS